eukprot:scaffold116_cov334-Pavlova_lutheri.AAC.28
MEDSPSQIVRISGRLFLSVETNDVTITCWTRVRRLTCRAPQGPGYEKIRSTRPGSDRIR